MSKVDHVLLQDEDEKHAPPSQEMLKLSYVGPGNGQPGLVFFEIVEATEYRQEIKSHDLKPLGSVAIDIKTFEQALELLKSN